MGAWSAATPIAVSIETAKRVVSTTKKVADAPWSNGRRSEARAPKEVSDRAAGAARDRGFRPTRN